MWGRFGPGTWDLADVGVGLLAAKVCPGAWCTHYGRSVVEVVVSVCGRRTHSDAVPFRAISVLIVRLDRSTGHVHEPVLVR